MADLIDDDILFEVAAQLAPLIADGARPGSGVAFFTHPNDFIFPGPRLRYQVVSGREFEKLTKEIDKRSRKHDGFHHPTSGFAAVCLDLLGDPYTREECLQAFSVPHEKLSGDEYKARAIALEWTISELPKIFAPEVDRQVVRARGDNCTAQMFHEKGYENDAREYFSKALTRIVMARVVGARLIVRHLGWSLDRDFCLRAARNLAKLVTCDLGLAKMTERKARHLCGW